MSATTATSGMTAQIEHIKVLNAVVDRLQKQRNDLQAENTRLDNSWATINDRKDQEISDILKENRRLNAIIQEGTEEETPLVILDMMDRCSKAEAKVEEYKQKMCQEVDEWKAKFQGAVDGCQHGSDITDHCGNIINHLHAYCEIDRNPTGYQVSDFCAFEREVRRAYAALEELEDLEAEHEELREEYEENEERLETATNTWRNLERDLNRIGDLLGKTGDTTFREIYDTIKSLQDNQK
tara:strand:+ start:2027 stop:2743 length:717 start_codon:yes stop_codon:yes gene_type:complete